MQLSHVLLVLSAAAATMATPVASPEETAIQNEQALFEEIAAKYGIDLDEPDELEARDLGLETRALNCYARGPTWSPNTNQALDLAGQRCSSGALSGNFRPGQLKGACNNISRTKYFAWHVQNNQDRSITLSSAACFRFLRGVINACGRGGTNDNGPWNWRADPQDGQC